MQNRVSSALSSLPQPVQAQGVTVQKSSTSILQIVDLDLAGRSLRQPVPVELRDHQRSTRSPRLAGVGNVSVFGAGQYAMRIWLDPQKLQARGLDPAGRHPGAAAAERAGHRRPGRPAAGAGRPGVPVHDQRAGKLDDVAEFENIIVKTGAAARSRACRTSRASSSARRATARPSSSTASRRPASRIFQLPDANALDVAKRVESEDDGAGARVSARP